VIAASFSWRTAVVNVGPFVVPIFPASSMACRRNWYVVPGVRFCVAAKSLVVQPVTSANAPPLMLRWRR
jgi:hypothetical protein